jgi:hypothetical protein
MRVIGSHAISTKPLLPPVDGAAVAIETSLIHLI